MVKTITELRREKAMLIEKVVRKAKNKKLFNTFIKQKSFEERKLRAEIKALKNPKSTAAATTAKKIGMKLTKLSFRGSVLLGRHLAAVSREQEQAQRKKRRKR